MGAIPVVVALAGVALAIALRFRGPLFSSAPNTDERVYLRAFRAVAAGTSPYGRAADQLDFYYPPPFARFGAAALAALGPLGDIPLVALLRAANVAGLVAALWISVRLAPLTDRWRLAAVVAYVALAPPALRHGLGAGNLSFAVVGSILLAFWFWPKAPTASGLLLGLGVLVKPIAPAGIALLALHWPKRAGRRHRLTAAVEIGRASCRERVYVLV